MIPVREDSEVVIIYSVYIYIGYLYIYTYTYTYIYIYILEFRCNDMTTFLLVPIHLPLGNLTQPRTPCLINMIDH